ncbi:DNA methyltransferase [Mycobacterium phage Miramae]|uniref:DNA methylase n=1 Tax=Mycobacterium phage Miramae TaxID=2517961 RepID=A0A482JFT7_9CAUD|nr:DNA methyltransferase [Mycobacterium phage Miramae]QBP31478.1 DNA methylase [Mycobacterium phage Miramae]QBP32459.1 DNA methylase [Mycobacterium phage AvatarAhPeg]
MPSLPTPAARDGKGPNPNKREGGLDLPGAVALLPTPTVHDTTGARRPEQVASYDRPFGNLNDAAVALLPTPLTTDSQGGGHHGDGGMDLRTTATHLYGTSEWGKFEPAIRRWEAILGREVPVPTEPNKNGNPRLNAAFSEWMMGWEEGWVTDLIEPSGRRAPEGKISRTAAMKLIGNGVVVQQAVSAIHDLLA